MAEWISVNDGLPDNGELVVVLVNAKPNINLAYINDPMIAQYWDNDGEYCGHWDLDDDMGFDEPEITYWMSLPELPKEVR